LLECSGLGVKSTNRGKGDGAQDRNNTCDKLRRAACGKSPLLFSLIAI
jgi:hypothetical protein